MKINGLIIEGIAGTGKTTFIKYFLKSKKRADRKNISSIILGEHYTQRILERKDSSIGLRKQDNLDLLDKITSSLEFFGKGSNQLEGDSGENNLFFLLERFHLTHVYRYNHMQWNDVEKIDSRLKKLNAKMCIFVIDKKDIGERIITDYIKSGWGEYLKKYGRNEAEIIENFDMKQKYLIEISQKSKIPTKIINTSKKGTKKIFDEILNFYENL